MLRTGSYGRPLAILIPNSPVRAIDGFFKASARNSKVPAVRTIGVSWVLCLERFDWRRSLFAILATELSRS